MKKFAIFSLVLALGATMLVGCGCVNTKPDVPTLPTNGEQVNPTQATQAPATEAATVPTTMATSPDQTAPDTTGTLEGAMDDILGTEGTGATGVNPGNAGENTVPGRSGSRRMPGR